MQRRTASRCNKRFSRNPTYETQLTLVNIREQIPPQRPEAVLGRVEPALEAYLQRAKALFDNVNDRSSDALDDVANGVPSLLDIRPVSVRVRLGAPKSLQVSFCR